MKSKKMSLNQLKINSFVTGKEKLTGGRWSVIECPHTGEHTRDYLGCNSLDDFYCGTQGDGDANTFY
jgi:hypothetical protein